MLLENRAALHGLARLAPWLSVRRRKSESGGREIKKRMKGRSQCGFADALGAENRRLAREP